MFNFGMLVFVLSYLLCYDIFDYYSLEVCLFSKIHRGMDLDGRGGWEKVEGIERGNCKVGNLFSMKGKEKKRLFYFCDSS